MALIGTAIAGALGSFGDKPKVPQFKPVNAGAEQLAAISGNLDALPGAEALSTRVNAFNQAELEKLLAVALPGFQNIRNKIGQNINSLVSGEIPVDVSESIHRNAAVKSLYGGFGGTGAARNLTARDLGLTSLSLTDKGLDSASRWLSSSAVAPRFDVSSMFISPQTRIQTEMFNTTNQFDRNWLSNQVKAAPDPFMRALGQAFIQDEGAIMSMAGSAAGAAGGGGGGGGGGM